MFPAGGAHEQRPGIVEVKITLQEQPAALDGRKVGLSLLLTFCLLFPQDMRKHVTMTLLDTEQSYVESLRTLMQVRLTAGPGP